MATYHSKFATTGIAPATRARFRLLKQLAAAVGLTALVLAAGFGLWRATLGMPEHVQLPGATIVEQTP